MDVGECLIVGPTRGHHARCAWIGLTDEIPIGIVPVARHDDPADTWRSRWTSGWRGHAHPAAGLQEKYSDDSQERLRDHTQESNRASLVLGSSAFKEWKRHRTADLDDNGKMVSFWSSRVSPEKEE